MNKIALAIGHKESSQGAVNKDSLTTEWGWNSRFVPDVCDGLLSSGWCRNLINIRLYHRTTTIRDLVTRINEWNPDLAVEFHCNSYKEKWLPKFMRFEKLATGTEMLMANCHTHDLFGADVSTLTSIVSQSIGILTRGNKYRTPKKNILGRYKERGAPFLWGVKCKAIIAETFFIDNNSDLAKVNENYDAPVQAYVDWFVNYFDSKKIL